MGQGVEGPSLADALRLRAIEMGLEEVLNDGLPVLFVWNGDMSIRHPTVAQCISTYGSR